MLCSKFKIGVRILIVTDSCHNGTIFKALSSEDELSKTFKESKSLQIYEDNKEFYNGIQLLSSSLSDIDLKCSRISLSACKDDEKAIPGNPFSEFTANILDVWKEGTFSGDYPVFIQKIKDLTPSVRNPQIKIDGNPKFSFLDNKPFTI